MVYEKIHPKLNSIIDRLSFLEGKVEELSNEVQNISHAINPSGFSSSIIRLMLITFTVVCSWLGVLTWLIVRG